MTDYLFEGLKVLDVGTWIAGPVAATILGDFGADVIKVEIPGNGDQYRILSGTAGTPDAETNYMWQMDGRNKRSLALNLKSPEGMEVLRKLVADCDVYVTNHPLPMRRDLGLMYEDLQKLNDRMIYASLTAYGEDGPERDREGFDLVAYWGRTGLMDLVRDPAAPPAQALPGMGDHPSAVSLYAGIVTALLKREKTGKGMKVHTSLLANGLWSMSCIAQAGFAGGSFDRYRDVKAARRFTSTLYQTQDNRWLQFTMVRTPDEFASLMNVLGLEDVLEDERFASPEARMVHGEPLAEIVQHALLQDDAAVWMDKFAEVGINVGRVGIVEETVSDEQVHINKMAVPPVDPSMNVPWIINHPVKADGCAQVGPTRAPEVGEHSAEVLMELGYSDDVIEAYREKGVI
jgi:crotonobetainyl-CoA:carnitine CoA-transferase CaiB-like acyl-CoA transferase